LTNRNPKINQPILAQEFPALWNELLKLENVLNYSGRFLYGDISALKEGNYYLLGYNPGGDLNEPTLRDDIKVWGGENNIRLTPVLQHNLNKLREAIAPRQFCWSNLYFERSGDPSLIKEKNEEIYWPVHEKVIEIIKPGCVFAFGVGKSSTPTYHKLKKLLGFEGNKESYFHSNANPDNDGWEPRVTEGRYKGRPLKLIGLPHLSRYRLSAEDMEKIKEECSLMDSKQ
jgi:hypothetical protein